MDKKPNIEIGSNKSFGIVFFLFFSFLSIWPLAIHGNQINYIFLFIGIIFLLLGILNSKILTPLNYIWFKFGIYLGLIISPIVMAIIFFMVVTPIGLFMRSIGKDLIRNKKDSSLKTYWLDCKEEKSSMKNQF